MNVNKKLDRFRHWAGEKMGGEVKTNTSDEFKALEAEMGLRQEGMERLHRSMNIYIKSLSKRNEDESKEKSTAVSQLGAVAISHADDFEPESEFGQCLSGFGRANERIARSQDTYVVAATTSWMESLERSLAQMKEYQTARKKLESRRLAFDTSQAKIQKSKKDDFRMEEELRSQRAKYEESSEDVYRRMLDIKEAEVDSIADLTSFLDAELSYYDRAREILLQLKQDWPGSATADYQQAAPARPRNPRSRASTVSAYRNSIIQEDDPTASLPIRARVVSAQPSVASSPLRERPGFDFQASSPSRPGSLSRTTTFEGPRSLLSPSRDSSPAANQLPRLSRVPTDSSIYTTRNSLRPVRTRDSGVSPTADVFSDHADDYGEDYYDQRAPSPMHPPPFARSASALSDPASRKMAPPPPPPSRSKKPPPPPPLKRSALSTSEVPFA